MRGRRTARLIGVLALATATGACGVLLDLESLGYITMEQAATAASVISWAYYGFSMVSGYAMYP